MPSETRALTRDARRRQADTGVPYTQARLIESTIRAYMSVHGVDYQTAAAHITPETTPMCEKCGWTYAMVCPECTGCGCSTGQCSGWRHSEYADEDQARDLAECVECGGDTRSDYGCHCAEGAVEHVVQGDEDQDDEDRRVDEALQARKDDRAMGYLDADGEPTDPDPDPDPEPDYFGDEEQG